MATQRGRSKSVVVEGEVISSADDDSVINTGLEIVIQGRSFPCRKVSISWELMCLTDAQQRANATLPSGLAGDVDRLPPHKRVEREKFEAKTSAAGMEMMAIMRRLVNKLLVPDVRQEFSDYMFETDVAPNELENAIGDVMAGMSGESGKAPDARTSSARSRTLTEKPSRAVSFNRGGGKAAPAEQS